MAIDASIVAFTRAALGFARDLAWTSQLAGSLFPTGIMGGWTSIAAILVGLTFVGAYGSGERWASVEVVFRGVALGAGLALWQSLDFEGVAWTVTRWTLVTLAVGLALATVRLALHTVVIRHFADRRSDRVIFVGDPQKRTAQQAARAILKRPGSYSLGWLTEEGGVDDYLGHPSAVWEVLCEKGTDTVVLCGDMPRGLLDTVTEAAAVAGCRVLAVRDRGPLMASQPRALNGGSLHMLELTFPAARAGQDVVKRAFDLVVAAVALLLLAPILTAIGIWIKLDSSGPMLFVQERVGQAGRIFRMLKFRTMRNGSDKEKPGLAHMNHTGDTRLFKIPHDPRVTRAGTFLRRWSLDELPQLVNVLRGEMSLVGPRPFFESDLAAYDHHHFIRLAVKPGLTGLWQVRGRSSIVDFEEVVRLDREYVEKWSIGLDLGILLQTAPAVIRRTGAY
ncbi:MAG TPA: exopolysaccharide biosynthesis polyprenyl glycosylphosphotransferase [Longimicrobiales bacterium]|nr:exopolysaccharide biosynthesis polyprenyl glycosylphosphotransferase [Longimicrobiales bacterium]